MKNRLFQWSAEVIDPVMHLECGHVAIGEFDMGRKDHHSKLELEGSSTYNEVGREAEGGIASGGVVFD
jgi:hypothetical protein